MEEDRACPCHFVPVSEMIRPTTRDPGTCQRALVDHLWSFMYILNVKEAVEPSSPLSSGPVNIAQFKRLMGRYLRRVRQGDVVVLSDRDVPFARVEPLRSREAEKAPPSAIRAAPNGYEGILSVEPLSFPSKRLSGACLEEDRGQR